MSRGDAHFQLSRGKGEQHVDPQVREMRRALEEEYNLFVSEALKKEDLLLTDMERAALKADVALKAARADRGGMNERLDTLSKLRDALAVLPFAKLAQVTLARIRGAVLVTLLPVRRVAAHPPRHANPVFWTATERQEYKWETIIESIEGRTVALLEEIAKKEVYFAEQRRALAASEPQAVALRAAAKERREREEAQKACEERKAWLGSDECALMVLVIAAQNGYSAEGFKNLSQAFRNDEQLWDAIKDRPGRGGMTHLMSSVCAWDEERTRWLLQRGSRVNAARLDGMTALLLVCELPEEYVDRKSVV